MIENEKKILKQKLDAQKFIKEVIEPIVDNLSEIPKNYLIGYVYLTYNSNPDNIVYKNLSNWQRGITASGYEKETSTGSKQSSHGRLRRSLSSGYRRRPQ